MNFKTAALPAGLYLIATPIGNLRDITLRALDTLAAADFVACEDTRVTGKLLKAHGIDTPLTVYNDHSSKKQRAALIEKITSGQAVALVSDSGTPLVSDPGYKLVRDCLDLGIEVTALPGANAPLTALQLSGLPSDSFSFAGFLPPKQAARRKALATWQNTPGSLIFFESGPRLTASLQDMHDILGNREAAVARELTKMYEETRHGTLKDLCAYYEGNGAPKGEIVIVTGPGRGGPVTEEDIETLIEAALEKMTVKDAAAYVAAQTGRPKKEIYGKALHLADRT